MPRKTALVCGSERYTYAQVDEQARQIARLLHAAGVAPLDRVAVCLENSADAVAWIFGVLKAGAVFFVVNPQARPEYRNQLIRDSGATAVVERDTAGRPFITRTANPLQRGPFVPDIDPDLAALVYTSGSTGTPKGVMLTHRNLTFAAESICTYLENTGDDVILSVLPLSFTYGLGQVTTAFHAGATLVLERIVHLSPRCARHDAPRTGHRLSDRSDHRHAAAAAGSRDAPVTAPALHHECGRRAAR